MSPYASLVVSNLGWTLLHFLWQGLLIGCATAVLLTVMRNARPQHRYTVACTALFMCLAWPVLEFYLRMQDAAAVVAAAAPAGGWALAPGTRPGGIAGYLQGNLFWVVALWAVCASVLAVRIALGLLWVKRAEHQYTGDAHWQARVNRMAAQFGITRNVRLRVVGNLASPITAGWWRPVLLVPASLISGMPAHLLEALLAWSRPCCSITRPCGGFPAASVKNANRLQTISLQDNWANRAGWRSHFPSWNDSSSHHITWPKQPMEETL